MGRDLVDAMTAVSSKLLELRMLIGLVPDGIGVDSDGVWKDCGRLRNHVYIDGQPTDVTVCAAQLRIPG